ncbi:MAG: tetratricopeptide repeat protein [Spirochaetales bacterium]
MARNVLVVSGLAILLSLTGCSQLQPAFRVMRGNVAYNRGDFQPALVHYLSTEEAEEDRGWLMFNIGNVYYAMGEQEAALRAWDEARGSLAGRQQRGFQNRETLLVHAASYNRGVLYYQRGQYRDALAEFRYALEVDNRSVAAKTNLELTLLRLESSEQAEQVERPSQSDGDSTPADSSTLRILDYVRRKEAQRWVANREQAEPVDSRDW